MKKQNGFGLISLLIIILIIGLLAWGGFSFSKTREKNRIQQGQQGVEQAQDAADQQNQYNQNLQDTTQGLDPPGLDYGSVRDKTNSLLP